MFNISTTSCFPFANDKKLFFTLLHGAFCNRLFDINPHCGKFRIVGKEEIELGMLKGGQGSQELN